MRRRGVTACFLALCAVAGVLSAAVLTASPTAGAETSTTDTTTTSTTPPPTTTAPTTTTAPVPTTPRPQTIPAGVTVGGILIGGLSPLAAQAELRKTFARPLMLLVGKRALRVTPKELASAALVGDAVAKARTALPDSNVPLKVQAPRPSVERWVRRLAARLDRAPVDSRLLLRKKKPFLTKDEPGRRLKQVLVTRDLVRQLKTHDRAPLELRFEDVEAKVTRESFGDVIVIRRGSNKLQLYDGMKLKRNFNVATGQSRYPTPLGRFHIIVKWKHPWWYPPNSDWAKDAKPVPPGPGNPLGTRWMGISSPAVGIHGTPDDASIGYSVSHGCIRMHIPEVEWLFEQVAVGTPVFIVSA